MVIKTEQPGDRLLLYSISWETYEAILEAFQGRHLRISYDRGTLEIMTLTLEHEFYKKLIARLIELMTYELGIALLPAGSTTLKRLMLERGLEPDETFWVQNEHVMRGKKRFKVDRDPPPDLAIEVDVLSSSVNRMGIYAALKVPEVWRFHDGILQVHLLGSNSKYKVSSHSRAFPFLPVDEFVRFLGDKYTDDQTALMQTFGKWIRETLAPAATKKNGKK